jgi:REP element-mobilizing transposase RayT
MIRKERKSPRLANWDYGSLAAYFITICTQDKEQYFGNIKHGRMQISPTGTIAHVLWHEMKNHAKNIELGEFVVMPNHVHGILILKGNIREDGGDKDGDHSDRHDGRDVGRDVACNVPTNVPTTNTLKNERMAAISPKSNTVSSIIRSYKSAVTKYCRRLELPMAWQPRFHDHIIRNDESFKHISAYIRNNPANWKEDTFY